MKKNIRFFAMLLCSTALIQSCTKENQENGKDTVETVAIEKINGEYKSAGQSKVLELNYSGKPMVGKSATFNTEDGKTGILSISELIPGEETTKITLNMSAVGKDGYDLSCETKLPNSNVAYTGRINEGLLQLNVEAEFNNRLAGTEWNLKPSIIDDFGDIKSKPLYWNWTSDVNFMVDALGIGMVMPVAPGDLIKMAGALQFDGKNMYELLLGAARKVTFKKDGNVLIERSVAGTDGTSTWENTPENVAFYYLKDDKFYLTINIVAALEQLSGQGNTVAEGEAPKFNMTPIINGMMPFLPMLSSGIEFTCAIDETAGMKLYLGTAILKPIFNDALVPFVQDPDNHAAIEKMLENDKNLSGMKNTAMAVINQLEGVVKESSVIELGLELQKKQ